MPRNSLLPVLYGTILLLAACLPAAPRAQIVRTAVRAASPEQAYQAYFAAMRANDFEQAAQWISNYSLQAEGWTRDSLRENLTGAWFGALRFQDLQILEVRYLNPYTAIIHDRVTIQQGRIPQPTTREQWNSARLEEGGWLVNAGDLVDYATFDLPGQAANGVTVRLIAIRRYAAGTRLTLRVENANGLVAWWGGADHNRLTVHAGGESIDAAGEALRFEAGQAYPNISIQVDRFLDAYPERVELTGWSLAPEPPGATVVAGGRFWSYTFDIPKPQIQ